MVPYFVCIIIIIIIIMCNYLLIIIIMTITHLLSFSGVCASEKRGLEPAGGGS